MDSTTQHPQEPTPKAPDKERAFVSAGERIHHWATYLGVDWIFNAISGVGFAHWGNKTETGRKLWAEPIDKGLHKALKPFLKEESLENGVKNGNIFFSIIAGGMMTIPPLLVLENKKNKKAITQSLDNTIYGKDTVVNDPKFAKAYDEMDHEAKKDFKTGMLARFAALAPLLASVLIPASEKRLSKYYFEPIGNGVEKAVSKIGITKKTFFSKKPPEESKKLWSSLRENIGMDLGLGVLYAPLHAFFYDKFSKSLDKENHTPAHSTPAGIMTASAQPPLEQPAAPTPSQQPTNKVQHIHPEVSRVAEDDVQRSTQARS